MRSLHKLGNPGLERIGTHLELKGGCLAHWDLNSSADYKMLCCLYPGADSGSLTPLCGRGTAIAQLANVAESTPFLDPLRAKRKCPSLSTWPHSLLRGALSSCTEAWVCSVSNWISYHQHHRVLPTHATSPAGPLPSCPGGLG